MKIRYAFDVTGHFRLPVARSVVVGDATVSVELSTGRVVQRLIVIFDVPPGSPLPTCRPSEEVGVALHVDFPDYGFLDRAKAIAENMQDHLCVLGVEAVDFESFDIKWIPESHEEQQLLGANDLRIEPGVPDEAFAIWRSAVFRAALRTQHDDDLFRLGLTFLRAGWKELKGYRHAGAFIFFFFFVESLFGNNQVKSKGLVRSLTKSKELSGATRIALSNQPIDSPYVGLDVVDTWTRLVDRRGYLLHNQTIRNRSWSDRLHTEISPDAVMLCSISTDVATKRLWPRGSWPPFCAMHDAKYDLFTLPEVATPPTR